MANVMDLKNVKLNVSRNGFDLSQKVAFSAKPGQVLPVGVFEVLPGDKFNMDLQTYTRTLPLNSAAYCRINQYFDVYYVRTNDLWNKFDSFALQLDDNVTKARDISYAQTVGENQPYFTRAQVTYYLNKLKSDGVEDCFGFKKYISAAKLLEYLGYGIYLKNVDGTYEVINIPDEENLRLNPFPLLGYQFIYQNSIRNQQWETSAPYTSNIDYIDDKDDLQIKIESLNGILDDLFDMHYSNWNKDYFMGLLPRSQYGDAATIPLPTQSDIETFVSSGTYFQRADKGVMQNSSTIEVGQPAPGLDNFFPLANDGAQLQSQLNMVFTKDDIEQLKKMLSADLTQLSALAIRQVEYVQKYKEILQSGSRDIKDVLEKIYGVDISNEDAHIPQFIGGLSAPIEINEVINQALETPESQANIKGKGTAVGNANIDFTAKYHGIIYVMYHAQPMLDYATSSISKLCLKTKYSDYAIPAFDKIGMQKVSLFELSANPDIIAAAAKVSDNKFLGYAPIYVDNKTNYDKMLGAFRENLAFWGCAYDDEFLLQSLQDETASFTPNVPKMPGIFNANFLRVNPRILDKLFAVAADDNLDTDSLLVNTMQQCYVTRNLDYNGLPY